MWNVGTCRSDAKGETQVEAPQVSEYRCGAQGRSDPYDCMDAGGRATQEQLPSSDEDSVMGLE